MTSNPDSRRPLASRGSALARLVVEALLKTSITPNQISVLSIFFAVVGAFALFHAPAKPWCYAVVMLGVQARLICNLLDGMVAVEGGRGSPIGSLYNEIPDRIADSLFLVAWGYAAGDVLLGWAAALAAAVTAYIRVLGGSLGLKQDFRGPMAKQHRMAALTIVCLLAMLETWMRGQSTVLGIGLWLVTIGSVWTCIARTRAIARSLKG